MKDCSSAFIQQLWRWGIGELGPQKLKILGTAACVQILILTVLFHQRQI